MHLIILITISAILFHTNSLQLCFIMHKITLSRSFFQILFSDNFLIISLIFSMYYGEFLMQFCTQIGVKCFFLKKFFVLLFSFLKIIPKKLSLTYVTTEFNISPVRIYFCVLKNKIGSSIKPVQLCYIYLTTQCVFLIANSRYTVYVDM